MKKRFVVKLGLAKKTIPQKTEFGNHVVASMTGNANFTTPNPPLSLVTIATKALETAAAAAEQGGPLATQTMHDRENDFDVLMTNEGRYVDMTANGDRDIILSAGMETKKEREPAQLPDAPVIISAKPGKVNGTVDLRIKRPKFGLLHMINMKSDGEDDSLYKLIATTTKNKFTVTGLASVKKIWFKVADVGTVGTGGFSDSAASVTT